MTTETLRTLLQRDRKKLVDSTDAVTIQALRTRITATLRAIIHGGV